MTATLASAAPAARIRIPGRNSAVWATAALAVVIVMQLVLVPYRAINWDEFWHYSQIHQLASGTLVRPLQTLHTSLFRWVIDLPGTGVDHIVVIRLFMFACEMATCAAIAGMAKRFTDRTTGLLCALAYLGGGFVMQHGFSFRFDPMVTALMMVALWVLLCRPLTARWIVLTGVLAGVAAMISIKIVLLGTAFAGVAWLRWNEHDRTQAYVLRLLAAGAIAGATFALVYLAHSQGIAGDNTREARTIVARSAGAMFSLGVQPYWGYAVKEALLAPGLVLLLAVAPFAILRERRPATEKLALAGFLAPVLLPLFYHNTAPYFYAFMLAPVLVACSAAMRPITARYGVALVAGLFVVTAGFTMWGERGSPIDKQRQLLVAAAEVFPKGTAYFDFCGFLGTFPKANPFMTPVSIRTYQSGALPSLRETMLDRPVPLVVDDDPMFERLLTTREPAPEFLPEDAAALRETYIPFWGPFWIAGKVIPAGASEHRVDLLVPGPYTVEGGDVTIDGHPAPAGSVVVLGRGSHLVTGTESGPTRIVWGERLRRPSSPAPDKPHWTYF